MYTYIHIYILELIETLSHLSLYHICVRLYHICVYIILERLSHLSQMCISSHEFSAILIF